MSRQRDVGGGACLLPGSPILSLFSSVPVVVNLPLLSFLSHYFGWLPEDSMVTH